MRGGTAHQGGEERDAERALLSGPFSGLSGDARRAGHRSDGASLGHPRLRDARRAPQRQIIAVLRGYRQRPIQATGLSGRSARARGGGAQRGAQRLQVGRQSERRRRARRGGAAHGRCPRRQGLGCWHAMASVHPTAIVSAGARLASDVSVGAFSVVGPEVDIGEGTTVASHAVIAGRTRIGRRNRIFQFASVGDTPQDRKYGGEPTATAIGDDNVIREYVSIHAGTAQDRGTTTIGDRNWLLAYAHIAHDCRIGNDTTFSNNSQLAGHVSIDDFATLGGFTGVHQFCRVGAHAMVAAGSIVLQDVPPFMTVSGYPARPAGTNNEGLRRRGFSTPDITAVRRAYKILYREGLSLTDAKAALVEAAKEHPVLAPLIVFLAEPGRGIVRKTREVPDT